MDHVLDAVVEIFAWIGIAGGVVFAIVTFALWAADGTWLPVHAVIDDGPDGRVARWFDDAGGVGEAPLPHEVEHALAGSAEADLYARRGSRPRVRLARTSHGVRLSRMLAIVLGAVGVVALVTSWVLLFARG